MTDRAGLTDEQCAVIRKLVRAEHKHDTGGGSQRAIRYQDALIRAGQAAASVPMADAAEMLWVVLANVSEGDWTKQTQEWQDAARRWRDYYFAAIGHAQPSLRAATWNDAAPAVAQPEVRP